MCSSRITSCLHTSSPEYPGGKQKVPNRTPHCSQISRCLVPGGSTSRQWPAFPTVAPRRLAVSGRGSRAPSRPRVPAVSGGAVVSRRPLVPTGALGASTGPPHGWELLLLGSEGSSQPPPPYFRVFLQGTEHSELLFAGHSVILTQYK